MTVRADSPMLSCFRATAPGGAHPSSLNVVPQIVVSEDFDATLDSARGFGCGLHPPVEVGRPRKTKLYIPAIHCAPCNRAGSFLAYAAAFPSCVSPSLFFGSGGPGSDSIAAVWSFTVTCV